MSCITENTLVVRASVENKAITDLRNYGCDGINCIVRTDEYVCVVYDCNGDSPWDICERDELLLPDMNGIVALETNYGDEDGPWTRVFDDRKGYLVDYDGSIFTYMKDILNESDYLDFVERAEYTIGGDGYAAAV
ncbi:MAG: hypothetical protein IKS98_08095 [Lachnospiraceae bacterium]|nr:hypothetical protein [Lachnospiraceae bacterium]